MPMTKSGKSTPFDAGIQYQEKKMAKTPKEPARAPGSCQVQAKTFRRRAASLFPSLSDFRKEGDIGGMLSVLEKREEPEGGTSTQQVTVGEKQHPFNMRAVAAFKNQNVHHSTCIEAKLQALVGLGHVSDKVEKVLSPLTSISWQAVLQAVAEDFWSVANGYLEVVWDRNRKNILGIHFIAGPEIRVVIENVFYEKHYIHRTGEGERRFAAWGDGLDFYYGGPGGQGRAVSAPRTQLRAGNSEKFSELIHIPDMSSMSRFYGYVNWLAAVASIELAQAVMQHQFDFHMNRGVPEFMLFVTGAKLATDQWEVIEGAIDQTIGIGNAHKTLAVNIDDPNVKVQVEKLALEATEDGSYFKDLMEALALNVVSAHRVPPILAGILIPGKLGAANETSNAILAFQALVIGPAQKAFTSVLDNTLGDPVLNGQLGLKPGDFKFKTIVDEIAEQMQKLQPMDTMGRAREQLADQAADGRDLEDGVKKRQAASFIVNLVKSLIEDGE